MRQDLKRESSQEDIRLDSETARMPGVWAERAGGMRYPGALSLTGLLHDREPTTVTQPLNFTGLEDNRLAIQSQRGLSWTDTRYKLQGMDATDSYQPGRPVMLPDIEALDEVVVRSAFAQTVSSSEGAKTGVFLAAPGASWHGAISRLDSGAALASTNLPAPVNRGLVQQPSAFRWLTSDHLETGGPLTRRADFFASGSGQWASQTEPLASPGTDQRSRLLYGNARGHVTVTARDLIDPLYSGSRINLTDGGVPSGMEALTSNRMAPSFVLPGGFPGQPEVDHLDFLQVGWTHLMPADSRFGAIEVRYGYSTAHLDTNTALSGQSRVELLGGAVSGAPPLANMAIRTRHEIEAIWQPSTLNAVRSRHHILAGGGWQTSTPRNRFSAPSGLNLVRADGAPAYAIDFNTPANTRELIRSFSAYLSDYINLAPSLSFGLGALADFSRGSLPGQSSPAGPFAPARAFTPHLRGPGLCRKATGDLSPPADFGWNRLSNGCGLYGWTCIRPPIAGHRTSPGSFFGCVHCAREPEWPQPRGICDQLEYPGESEFRGSHGDADRLRRPSQRHGRGAAAPGERLERAVVQSAPARRHPATAIPARRIPIRVLTGIRRAFSFRERQRAPRIHGEIA